ncbi:MAG: cyclopropane fatty acyl phospholipid synthase [Candidatus Staskawiczbacteria bacterium]|nr:cyclopropane fatty acyl phospholipid synthase [Candidatus Staskawiczbacteria bacterium]
MENNFRKIAENLLKPAGIGLDGKNPWDIKIINPNFYSRVLLHGSLGLGEAYMEAWWECKKLDEFFYRLLKARVSENIMVSWPVIVSFLKAKFLNLQSVGRAFQVGERHYDLDNELFEMLLGKTMAYSCGYWRKAKTLDSAQNAKFDLICKKLGLKKGPASSAGRQKILDIGCGWGGFAKYAAENYKVKVVGVTVSKEQASFAKELCKGLLVEIKVMDYRDLNEQFDHIVSVGMFEHVGPKNYKLFMEVAKRCLKENGLFLLHTIGSIKSENNSDPWLNKYIFPNGTLPSLRQISQAVENLFLVEDVHNFGPDYEKTLIEWHKNFEKSWVKLKGKYDDKFYRMWNYYLLSCVGAFRARRIQLWQIVLSLGGVPGGYKSVR